MLRWGERRMDELIETKIKNIEGRNFCRACHHFIRVNNETVQNVMHRQGFCILGQLEGNYSLYYSCSASECVGFLLDNAHYDIAMAEQKLSEDEKAFAHLVNDKRSSNFKRIAPLVEETRKYIESVKSKNVGLGTIMAMREAEVTALKYFRENNQERYLDVYKMVNLRKAEYLRFVAKISVQIHDEFCKCDKIEYNELIH